MSLSGAIAALLARWTTLEAEGTALVGRIIALVMTLLAIFTGYRVGLRLVGRGLARLEQEGAYAQRARTLGPLLTNTLRWTAAFLTLIIVLRELGIDVRALLVSAGVVGLAVGLGAQSLIRDVLTGVFLLFERLIAVGDVVQVGTHTGTVEAIGLRVTQVRMPDGGLRIIPNGQLTDFANYSAGWALAAVEVTLPGDVGVERGLGVLRAVGEQWAGETGAALEPPQAQGIMRWSGSDVVLRLVVKVAPGRRLDTEMELRRRVKDAFDREGWRATTV